MRATRFVCSRSQKEGRNAKRRTKSIAPVVIRYPQVPKRNRIIDDKQNWDRYKRPRRRDLLIILATWKLIRQNLVVPIWRTGNYLLCKALNQVISRVETCTATIQDVETWRKIFWEFEKRRFSGTPNLVIDLTFSGAAFALNMSWYVSEKYIFSDSNHLLPIVLEEENYWEKLFQGSLDAMVAPQRMETTCWKSAVEYGTTQLRASKE